MDHFMPETTSYPMGMNNLGRPQPERRYSTNTPATTNDYADATLLTLRSHATNYAQEPPTGYGLSIRDMPMTQTGYMPSKASKKRKSPKEGPPTKKAKKEVSSSSQAGMMPMQDPMTSCCNVGFCNLCVPPVQSNSNPMPIQYHRHQPSSLYQPFMSDHQPHQGPPAPGTTSGTTSTGNGPYTRFRSPPHPSMPPTSRFDPNGCVGQPPPSLMSIQQQLQPYSHYNNNNNNNSPYGQQLHSTGNRHKRLEVDPIFEHEVLQAGTNGIHTGNKGTAGAHTGAPSQGSTEDFMDSPLRAGIGRGIGLSGSGGNVGHSLSACIPNVVVSGDEDSPSSARNSENRFRGGGGGGGHRSPSPRARVRSPSPATVKSGRSSHKQYLNLPLELETSYWLESVPFLELEASSGNNQRAEEFLSAYRTFDDVSAWKKRNKDQRATFTISFSSTDGPGTVVGAACLFWEYINNEAYVCLPYFGTMFGMRSKKLGMILVHYMLGRVHADGYERLYLPATKKAQSFWERMGATEITCPDALHTKEVIDEMHCFSASTTTLMCIELKGNCPSKPLLPSYSDLEHANMAGTFFRRARMGDYYQAAALIETFDIENLRELRIKGWSPLHESVQRDDPNEALKLTQLLLERKCNPNARDDEWKQTPLYYCANMDRVDIARLLVQFDADVNHRDIHHQPALFYAAKHNAIQVAKYLIEDLGISPGIKDKAGRRAIMYAKQANTDGSHRAIIEYLEDREAKRKKITPKAAASSARAGRAKARRVGRPPVAGRPRLSKCRFIATPT